jgi:hypothetical protein
MFFSEKFGLFHVDFNDPDRKRTAKKSAEIYSQIITSSKIPVELLCVEGSQWSSENVGSADFNTTFDQDICEWICWNDDYGNFYITKAVISCFMTILLLFVCLLANIHTLLL